MAHKKYSNSVAQYFYNIYEAVTTTFIGLGLTIKTFFTKPVTVRYPKIDIMEGKPTTDKVKLPEEPLLSHRVYDRFRGVLFNDVFKCTACGLCAQICPIDCIYIEAKKIPDGKGLVLFKFDIDEARCMHCGLCVDICPVDSLVFTREFDMIKPSTDEMIERFVDEETNQKLIEIAREKAKKAAAKKAAAKTAAAKPAAKPAATAGKKAETDKEKQDSDKKENKEDGEKK